MSKESKIYLTAGYFRISSFKRRSPKRQRTDTSRYTCVFEKNDQIEEVNMLKLAEKKQAPGRKVAHKTAKEPGRRLRASFADQNHKEPYNRIATIRIKKG